MSDEDNAGETEPVANIPDISVYEAKISELTARVEAETARASDFETALNKAKADNYDLLMATPTDSPASFEEDSNIVDADIDIDDLFETKD